MSVAPGLSATEASLLRRLAEACARTTEVTSLLRVRGPQAVGESGLTLRHELLVELGTLAAVTGALAHGGFLDDALLADRRVEVFVQLADQGLLPDSEGAFGGP